MPHIHMSQRGSASGCFTFNSNMGKVGAYHKDVQHNNYLYPCASCVFLPPRHLFKNTFSLSFSFLSSSFPPRWRRRRREKQEKKVSLTPDTEQEWLPRK